MAPVDFITILVRKRELYASVLCGSRGVLLIFTCTCSNSTCYYGNHTRQGEALCEQPAQETAKHCIVVTVNKATHSSAYFG